MLTPKIHIAILTHNALKFTKRCLARVAHHTAAAHSLYILDNASRDGTREWLGSRRTANTKLILSSQNLGVAAGRNRLLRAIMPRAKPNDFLVFLDNDVEVSAGWDQTFTEVFAKFSNASIAGVTGHQIYIEKERRGLRPSPEVGPAEVDVVSGFCLWVRAAVAGELGPFDENLGLFWHEDDDYCIRAIGLGCRVYAVPQAPVLHHAHQSGAALDPNSEQLSISNQRYLIDKWRGLHLVSNEGFIARPKMRVSRKPVQRKTR
jgi:GT2 family glycosyltransferase